MADFFMIYETHAESHISEEDLRTLYPANRFPFGEPRFYHPVRLRYDMFKMTKFNQASHPTILVVKDDDGPFAVCTPDIREEWAMYMGNQIQPRGYAGAKSIFCYPMVVRKSVFCFPEEKRGAAPFFWGLNRPNPFDEYFNVFTYMSKYYRINMGSDEELRRRINRLYGELLEQADPDCLKTARKWEQQHQGFVMTACVKGGERVRQLFDSFPVLAWLIYVKSNEYWNASIAPDNMRYIPNIQEVLRHMVDEGLPLKQIAREAGVHFRLRNLDPRTASPLLDAHPFYLLHPRNPVVINSILKLMDSGKMPRDRWRLKIWREVYRLRLNGQHLKWLYRELEEGAEYRLEELSLKIGDWIKKGTGKLRWQPGLSWLQARNRSKEWHRQILQEEEESRKLKRRIEEEAEKLPFPDAWFGACDFGEWRIEYIPDRQSLEKHGREQRNCVFSYRNNVARGEQQIYRARFGEQTKLTIQIRMYDGHMMLGQVAATANTNPTPEQSQLVNQWFSKCVSEREQTQEYEEVRA